MKVTIEISDFYHLQQMCWSGATATLAEIQRQGKEEECMALLEELFYEGADDVIINDFVWFDIERPEFLNLFPKDWEEEDEEEEDEEEEDEEE